MNYALPSFRFISNELWSRLCCFTCSSDSIQVLIDRWNRSTLSTNNTHTQKVHFSYSTSRLLNGRGLSSSTTARADLIKATSHPKYFMQIIPPHFYFQVQWRHSFIQRIFWNNYSTHFHVTDEKSHVICERPMGMKSAILFAKIFSSKRSRACGLDLDGTHLTYLRHLTRQLESKNDTKSRLFSAVKCGG